MTFTMTDGPAAPPLLMAKQCLLQLVLDFKSRVVASRFGINSFVFAASSIATCVLPSVSNIIGEGRGIHYFTCRLPDDTRFDSRPTHHDPC